MMLNRRVIALVGLLYFSSLAAAWIVDISEGNQCNWGVQGIWGTLSQCIRLGGNSWAVADYDNGGCWFSSWSGNNCRGSSTQLTQNNQCQQFPFGSIKVEC
jgi:hypothetical protein